MGFGDTRPRSADQKRILAGPWTWLFLVATGACAGALAAWLLGGQMYSVGPFGIYVSWVPSPTGVTVLEFPPLGAVSAATHRGPSRLVASLQAIDFDALGKLVSIQTEGWIEAFQPMIAEGLRLARLAAWRLVALAAAGGGFGGLVAYAGFRWRAPWSWCRAAGLSAGSGALALVVAFGLAYATYDAQAFRKPTYRGGLESIPWVIEAVQDALGQVEEVETRLRTLVRNVYEMYQRIEELPPPIGLDDADVTILHVTDFHNHPAAIEIAREIAGLFDVDFAVNTGDLTDFGTQLEAGLLDALREFPVPHYLVTGNHESPDVVASLTLIEPVRLLDGQLAEESGIRLLGIGDPGAMRQEPAALSPAEARRIASEINEALLGMDPRPDVIAVHNHRVGTAIRPGLVPLVLSGHSHSPGVSFRQGTAYVNAGTTGGAGVRGLETEEPVRISLAVIYLSLQGGVRTLAVDLIRLSPIAEGFTLERHLAPAP